MLRLGCKNLNYVYFRIVKMLQASLSLSLSKTDCQMKWSQYGSRRTDRKAERKRVCKRADGHRKTLTSQLSNKASAEKLGKNFFIANSEDLRLDDQMLAFLKNRIFRLFKVFFWAGYCVLKPLNRYGRRARTNCSQTYKAFTLVIYDSRVIIWGIFKSGSTLESQIMSIEAL